MQNLLIFGSSGHARVVIDLAERDGRFRIAGLVDSFRPAGESTLGHAVLGAEADLPALAERFSVSAMAVAVGHNEDREAIVGRIRAVLPGMTFPSLVHPSAHLGRDVSIGEGTVVMAGVTVNPAARAGRFCILNTHCVLEHDAVMEDFSSLAPGALVAGAARIGAHAAVCLGARVTPRRVVGAHSVVGAGATVLHDIEPWVVAHGTPARTVRARASGDRY